MARPADISVDVTIVGGGIAGLWLLNLLSTRGYAAVLLSEGPLGAGQTLASQGIIHGGIKYALGGELTRAAAAIAGMPERWRRCLDGADPVNLSSLPPRAETLYLFAAATGLGKLTSFFASKALRGRIHKVPPGHWPEALAGGNLSVYTLEDFVLNTPALLTSLLAPVHDRAFGWRLDPESVRKVTTGYRIELPQRALNTRKLVLAAGAGTQLLLDGLAITEPRMQLRPLQQLIVRDTDLPPLYAHCLTGISRAEPRLTITSHPDGNGWLWYLGGQLASDGARLAAEELITRGRSELGACLPWRDWRDADISTLSIDRAEAASRSGRRPDEAFVRACGDCIVCWPTKMSLVPDLGDRVSALLPPAAEAANAPTGLDLPAAGIGRAPWED